MENKASDKKLQVRIMPKVFFICIAKLLFMQGNKRLEELSDAHKDEMPEDIRETREFGWYLDEVIRNPKVARNSHQRLADMFDEYGTEYNEDWGIVEYKIASEDPLHDGKYRFYGKKVHESIHDFVNKIKSGARGLGPEKRIKLLLGPVGSGKSEFDKIIRRYFEDYTLSESGRMYTFRWTQLTDVIDDQDPTDDTRRSPMNQDPLVLLPQERRDEIIMEANDNLNAPYSIRNSQELDPESAFYMDKLMEHYDENLAKVLRNHVEVIRLSADENQRDAIETFEPKDKKNQDETELTGDVNYSKLAVYGESDPRAFDYSGAFCNANRGIFSGEELFKLQREFLYDFLHATQEQTIKPKNNPRIDIDQVIVGRTNLPEFQEKSDDDKMEAFLDRTERVDFPYILQYEDEAKIHRKHLNNSDIPEVHIEPHTLKMTAYFSVLTRIHEPKQEQINLPQKIECYNGTGDSDINVDKIKENAELNEDSEGMFGISPRVTSDIVANTIIDETLGNMDAETTSITPLSVFESIEDNLSNRGSIDEDKIETYEEEYMSYVRQGYKRLATEDVRQALAYDEEEINQQGEKYMDHVMAYINDDDVEDSVTGTPRQPDESFMRSVEMRLDIPENRKDDFRQEIANWVSRRAREGETFNPQDNERIQRALEKKIWNEKKHNISFSALIGGSDVDESDDGTKWVQKLKKQGYSQEGAKEVLEYAGAIIAKEELD
jgi:serine protein kinase